MGNKREKKPEQEFCVPDIIVVIREREEARKSSDRKINQEAIEMVLGTQGVINLRMELRMMVRGQYRLLRMDGMTVKCRNVRAVEMVRDRMLAALRELNGAMAAGETL